MDLPLEIMRLILRDLTDALKDSDLLQLRLVNSLFADEIVDLIIRVSIYKIDDTLILDRWPAFPYKLAFYKRKAALTTSKPCLFQTFVQKCLDLPENKSLSSDEQDSLIGKFIPTLSWGAFNVQRHMSSPSQCRPPLKNPRNLTVTHFGFHLTSMWGREMVVPETIQESLSTALTISAIVRDDVEDLARVLDERRPAWLAVRTERLKNFALEAAAVIGSKEVVSVLVARRIQLQFYKRSSWDLTNLVQAAVDARNKDALEASAAEPNYNFLVGLASTSIRREMARLIRRMEDARDNEMRDFIEALVIRMRRGLQGPCIKLFYRGLLKESRSVLAGMTRACMPRDTDTKDRYGFSCTSDTDSTDTETLLGLPRSCSSMGSTQMTPALAFLETFSAVQSSCRTSIW
ncbi:hypothetical protein BJX64DRAFT_289154 [Aspergillus heterothallicus]